MAKRLISSCILFFIVLFFSGCGAPKKLISLVDIAEVKMVKVDDMDIAYRAFGHGEPLILIIGYTGTMDIWCPKVLNEFAKYYQVIIFDNRGMGLTSVGNKEFTIDLFGNDTAGLLDALNIKKANVLGWSMGTEIALSVVFRSVWTLSMQCFRVKASVTNGQNSYLEELYTRSITSHS